MCTSERLKNKHTHIHEAAHIQIKHASLNKDGGRYQLPAAYSTILKSLSLVGGGDRSVSANNTPKRSDQKLQFGFESSPSEFSFKYFASV